MPHPNPNSQKALDESALRRRRPGRDRKIKITQDKEQFARATGEGSLTDGIDRLFDRLFALLSVSFQAKSLIETSLEYLPAEKRELAESVLRGYEDLEIE